MKHMATLVTAQKKAASAFTMKSNGEAVPLKFNKKPPERLLIERSNHNKRCKYKWEFDKGNLD